MRRSVRRASWMLAGAGGLAAAGVGLLLAPYPPPDFEAMKGRLAAVPGAGTPHPGTSGGDFTLHGSSGLEVRARLRLPAGPPGPFPAALVFGGLGRGRGAVDLAAQAVGETPVALAALDYAYEGDPEPRGWALVAAARRARPALLRTVAGARLLLDFLAAHPRIRADRIVLIGVSLGGPMAVAVGGMDARPAAVACLFGADLPDMIGHAVRPRLGPLAAPVVALARWHLRDVDARRYAAAIAPRPFLVVGARGDRRVPEEAIEALAAAGPTARLVWLETPHPNPAATQWLHLAAGATRAWLAEHRLVPSARTPG